MSIMHNNAHLNSRNTSPNVPSTLQTFGAGARLLMMALLVLPTAGLATWSLYEIFKPNHLTALETAQLGLSMLLFIWLAMSFWTAAIGFVLKLFNIDPLSLRKALPAPDTGAELCQRHAVVMPVYNEDTRRIMVGFEACVRELAETSNGKQFDFYMLSDTTEPARAEAELNAWQALTSRLGIYSEQVFYRRREQNTGRKVGNLADFCQRWGSRYEAMIVLDADSVMSGERMADLAYRIEQNPDTALIQTIPMPVRQNTFFARFVQFAAHLYSPMLATGLSFWQTDSANYWGHNAIIRIAPFIQHCGLPTLAGKAPFGGEILSHDFVEAALLRRAGWQAYLLTDTTGSYEEVPSNMLEYATRDRRWVQGNIQHLGLLSIKGLKLTSRLHFLFGAFAYMSSLLLLLVLAFGTADALYRALTPVAFFSAEYQLFPDWQIARQGLMFATMWMTVALLFMPKILGLVLAIIQRRNEFGGVWRLLKGGIMELAMAIIIAPLMMFYHSYFVLSVFVGHSVKWEAQAREGSMVPWLTSLRRGYVATLVALVWGGVTFYYTPGLFTWLLPVLSGLLLAAPLIRLTSSPTLGQMSKRAGIFVIQDELNECRALKRVRRGMANISYSETDILYASVPALPATAWRPMIIQDFTVYPDTRLPLAAQTAT
ncbi:glucans biosynthesis glucosyltransferase MdoH [Alteromonas gilva]|uniref:Glucans biosynthesis glucosyltransferase H n=1 Tax=Alteromonas gilva TaxID=2987522 RepID=A0ABT5KYJ4_9ALTE|nr:glucans biosynthesis glucosyltransferase MdoH [Alteromonas gilva]MDC8829331.1 glucans biosynthesis glucosyltransferase MdoH [Alteromonas gilva]